MTWEALTAVSTALTALVILATVIYAARQVGALNAQIEHLRRATQLDGTLAIFEELFSPDYMLAYRFVVTEFEERMKDPTFHAEALEPAPDVETHKERIFLRHMERIGTLIKNELLDGNVVYDFIAPHVTTGYEKLGPLIREQRRTLGEEHLWENFEFIATETSRIGPDSPQATAAEARSSPAD